jgi:hypothetical protein
VETSSSIAEPVEILADEFGQEAARHEIIEQLERVASSSHFRNSKRYPALLRCVVEETLAGREESLKERTLGHSVFDRTPDYDTAADPVVRVSAGEVRKRIAQYYQSPGHENELRIEIPLGSYHPRFFRPTEVSRRPLSPEPSSLQTQELELVESSASTVVDTAPQPVSSLRAQTAPMLTPPRHSRFHLAAIYLLLLLSLSVWAISAWQSSRKSILGSGEALFWEKVLQSPNPTLIVLGVHSFDLQGNDISAVSHASLPQPQQTLLSAMTRSDMVHLSDVTSYGSLTELLAGHRHLFLTQGAADTTLEQLREGPFILVGGFNNLWTTRLTQQLRFRFVTLNRVENVIQDAQHPSTVWTLNDRQSALSNVRDYGLVSCFLDPETEQYVILAGGIGKSGTEAATDFITNEKEIDAWLAKVSPANRSNVQVVISTEVIEGKHGPPHVIASYFW